MLKWGRVNLIGDPGTTEFGYALLLAGTALLAIVFAIQTAMLSRKLRKREAYSRQMEELAYNDQLTGLPNRRLLFDRLQQALHAAERDRNTTAIFFIDLDEFKAVNDKYGHEIGDQVLLGLGRRWSAALRATDTIARWGGDEFVAVISGVNSVADIRTIVDRLKTVSEAPLEQTHNIRIQLSVGVAVGSLGSEVPEDLIRRADAAMYRAKRAGASPKYEIVGRQETLERIAGLPYVPDPAASDTDFIQILV